MIKHFPLPSLLLVDNQGRVTDPRNFALVGVPPKDLMEDAAPLAVPEQCLSSARVGVASVITSTTRMTGTACVDNIGCTRLAGGGPRRCGVHAEMHDGDH